MFESKYSEENKKKWLEECKRSMKRRIENPLV